MDLLTVKETAQLLRVSPITIRRYIASGRLSAERVGRGIRVRRESIEAFVAPVVPSAREGFSDWSSKPPGYADRHLVEVWSPAAPQANEWVPIDRLDEYQDERSGNCYRQRNFIDRERSNDSTDTANELGESFPGPLVESGTDGSGGDVDDERAGRLPTVLEALGISVGIFRTGEPTNIAEHKHDYLAEAFERKG
jgi:excisionase family DNA binding protein